MSRVLFHLFPGEKGGAQPSPRLRPAGKTPARQLLQPGTVSPRWLLQGFGAISSTRCGATVPSPSPSWRAILPTLSFRK